MNGTVIKNLVFEGGGVKGLAYAGAMQALEKAGLLNGVKAFAGTSAGAITAALLACGCNATYLRRIAAGTDFSDFQDNSIGVIRDMWRLVRKFGWNQGDAFAVWMKRNLKMLTDDADITFSGLYHKQGKRLYIIGTNLTEQSPELYSTEETPDMPVWEAVRISMGIPFFFEPWRRLKNLLVDGGMTWNYPIDLFDDALSETLGFRVDSKKEAEAGRSGWRPLPIAIGNLKDFCMASIGLMMDAANRTHLKEEHVARTVFIDGCGVPATDFSLTAEQKRMLVESGYKATKIWIDENASLNSLIGAAANDD